MAVGSLASGPTLTPGGPRRRPAVRPVTASVYGARLPPARGSFRRQVRERAETITVSGRITVTGSEPHVMLVIVTDDVHYELVGSSASFASGFLRP